MQASKRTVKLEKIMEERIYDQFKKSTMSPITQIVNDLSKSTLSDGRNQLDLSADHPINDKGIIENGQSLFKNVFKIKNTPEGTVKSRLRGRRLLGMAVSRRISSPEVQIPSFELVDKENAASSPQKTIEMMNTGSSSSSNSSGNNMKSSRLPLEDCDPNSQDSGYSASFHDQEDLAKCPENFRFAEPLGVAPKRMASIDSSPIGRSPRRYKRPSSKFLMKKLSSGYESTDDDFNDLLDMDTFMEGGATTTTTSLLPNDMNKLLSGDIMATRSEHEEKPMETDAATTPEFARTKPLGVRRSISINNDRLISKTPPLSRVRSCLFRSPNATSSTSRLGFEEKSEKVVSSIDNDSPSTQIRSFKRPEPPTAVSPILVKRSRKCQLRELEPTTMTTRHLLQKSHSETEAHAQIKSAIHRSTTDADLTGDFSKTCILPLAEGHHEDLKSISVDTLAGLIRGDFNDSVGSFKIVDCRYPYEYEAGHIDGAMNLYTKELIEQYLMNPLNQTPEIQPDTNKRNILVFHCEFSWERGPNLSRYLRNIDRKLNKEHYPALHYPEIYLLHGGYQQFYQKEKELCTPQDYRPMTHPDHEADLRKFRSKSKSWQGEKNTRTLGLSARTNLKRLGL